MARPTDYTPEIATAICRELAEGRSLVSICRDEGMPARSTVYQWLDAGTDGFPDRYARARTRQADAMADDILDIADETSFDTIDGKHGPMPNGEWIMRSKVRIDARKWLMAKLAPKKYGDSKQVDVTSKGERITGFRITDVTDDDSDA